MFVEPHLADPPQEGRAARLWTAGAGPAAALTRRRAGGCLLLAGLAGLGPTTWAQSPPLRIGVLTPNDAGSYARYLKMHRDLLRQMGVLEGRDYLLAVRHADGQVEALPRLAAELAAMPVAVIIAPGPSIIAALEAASPVPVVGLGDLADAAARAGPLLTGKRLTGVSLIFESLHAKRLELLAQLLPRGSAVLALGAPGARGRPGTEALLATGRQLGLVMHITYGLSLPEIDEAFALARRLKVAAMLMLSHPLLNARRAHVIAHAARARLPVMYQWPDSTHDGGLMGYGVVVEDVYGQVTRLAWRVATGSQAADLPVEQPTRVVLSINLKTARELGLRVPAALLARADEVIQ